MIHEDQAGDLWLGTTNGLYSFDKSSHEIKYYNIAKAVGAKVSSSEIRSIEADSKGDLWLGTLESGLFHFDVKKKIFKFYAHDPNDPHSLSNNTVLSIYIDPNDTLWVGAFGLNKFHPSEEKFYYYTEKDGLANDVIYGILEDGDYLWLSTNNGVSRFNRKTETFRNYQSK